MNSKLAYFLVFFMVLIPTSYGFTIDGPLFFHGPGGGLVVFQNDYIVTQFNTIGTINRFTGTTMLGIGTGNTGFDCDTGDNMTITNITPTTLTYTITGAGQQRIYFQGYGKPNEITGGTVVVGAGNTLVVTTTGAGTVTMTWYTNVNNIVNDITGYIVVLALVPMTLAGAFIIKAMGEGELTIEHFVFVLGLVIGLFVLVLIWLAMTKNY